MGLNYADHAAESNMALPSEPIIFFKATTCIVGPNDDVILPPGSTKGDWEVELGIVLAERPAMSRRTKRWTTLRAIAS